MFNTAVDNGSLDVYLTGSDDALDDASATVSAVTGGSVASYSTVTSGTYRLRVTGAGDKNDLRLDVPAMTLGSTQVATLIVTPGQRGRARARAAADARRCGRGAQQHPGAGTGGGSGCTRPGLSAGWGT